VVYDTDDFEKDIIERSREVPVLVDFWAAWCGPCKILGSILERLAGQADGEWVLAKLDTEKFPQIASQYGIRSIPNVKLFVNGQVKDEFIGALPEVQVVQWLRKAVPSKYQAQLEGASQFLREGRMVEARELLEHIVAAEADNERAAVLLAQTHLDSDPQQAVKAIESVNLGSESFEQAEAIRTLAAMFGRTEAPESLPEDPVREMYQDAIGRARSSDFEAALEGFIEVIRKNRYYDDDGSRKACIAIFKLLGEDSQLTKEYRRVLSNALY